MDKRRVALCTFATGRYKEFLQQLADSAKQHFLVNHDVELIAFTDGDPPQEFDRHYNVPHLLWPYGTLYRYRWLYEQITDMRNYEYVFMCDVDMRFVDDIANEILGNIVAVLHAGHLNKRPRSLPFVRESRSAACIIPGRGMNYYAGGFQGGSIRRYMPACKTIDTGIQQDERRGIMAEWHDESHWNAYLARNSPAISLPPQYCWGEPEGCPPGTKILALAKDHSAYRSGGTQPAKVSSSITPIEPIPCNLPEIQQAAIALKSNNLTSDLRNRIVATLEQMASVITHINPRICCEGAQHNLEPILRELLPNDPVVYVDVGASEPIDCSNTWQFYLCGGHGLLIEPRPSCWPSLLTQRPRDHLWPTAVAKTSGWAQMTLCGSSSTIQPDWTKQNRGIITVQTNTLKEILSHYPDIASDCEFLSIDVEGSEEQVIQSTPWTMFHPRVVVIEYATFEQPNKNDIRGNDIASMMGELGYATHYRDSLNLVFTRIPE